MNVKCDNQTSIIHQGIHPCRTSAPLYFNILESSEAKGKWEMEEMGGSVGSSPNFASNIKQI